MDWLCATGLWIVFLMLTHADIDAPRFTPTIRTKALLRRRRNDGQYWWLAHVMVFRGGVRDDGIESIIYAPSYFLSRPSLLLLHLEFLFDLDMALLPLLLLCQKPLLQHRIPLMTALILLPTALNTLLASSFCSFPLCPSIFSIALPRAPRGPSLATYFLPSL